MKTQMISKFFFPAVLLLSMAGCHEPEPIWEEMKITDLKPASGSGNSGKLKTVSFDVHKIEFAAGQLENLNKIYEDLQSSVILLNSPAGFKKNLFRAGLGREKAWRRLNRIYTEFGGEVISSLSYLINLDQPNYIPATFMDSQKDVFYYSSEDNLKGVTIGRGNLSFQITASQIPDTKSFCRLSVVPAFPQRNSGNPSVSEFDISDDVIFSSVGFHIRISPGDFILIGPREYIPHQYTLPAVLFCSQKPEPVVRIFLILCKQINL